MAELHGRYCRRMEINQFDLFFFLNVPDYNLAFALTSRDQVLAVR